MQDRYIQTVSKETWRSLSQAERVRTIANGVVHVVGCSATLPYGITGLDDPKFRNLVNLDALREGIGEA